MEATIKQAEEERMRAVDSSKKLYEEYCSMKDEVNQLRTTVGLSSLIELEQVDEKLKPGYV